MMVKNANFGGICDKMFKFTLPKIITDHDRDRPFSNQTTQAA